MGRRQSILEEVLLDDEENQQPPRSSREVSMAGKVTKQSDKSLMDEHARHKSMVMDDERRRSMARLKRLSILGNHSLLNEEHNKENRTSQKPSSRVTSWKAEQNPPQPQRVFTDEELAALYSTTIKLSQENKITAKNSWNFDLIENLEKLLQGPAGETQTNFQLAGCSLDAGVKIYSYRVDSTHSNFYRFLGHLQGTDDGSDIDEDGENGAESGQNTQSKSQAKSKSQMIANLDDEKDADFDGGDPENPDLPKVNKTKKRAATGANTLESNWDTITMKTVELDYVVDPLFRMMSAAFDQGGARGMIQNHLKLGKDCEILIDSSEPAMFSSEHVRDRSLVEPFLNDVYSSKTLNEYMLPKPGQPRVLPRLCPGFYSYIQAKRGNRKVEPIPIQSMDTAKSNGPELQFSYEKEDIEENSFWRTEEDEEQQLINSLNEDHGGDSDNENGFGDVSQGGDSSPDHQSSVGTNKALGVFQSSAAHMVSSGADLFEAGLALNSNMSLSFFDTTSFVGWAGPNHWQPAKAKNKSVNEKDASSKQCMPKGKARILLDFGKPVNDVEFLSAFKPAKSANSFTLSNALREKQSEAMNTLPDDKHYELKDLMVLYTKPHIGIRSKYFTAKGISSKHVQAAMIDMVGTSMNPGSTWNDDEENGFDDAFGEAVDFVTDNDDTENGDSPNHLQAPSETSGTLQLMKPPQLVEKVDIAYAQTAKRVDVQKLKKALWQEITSASSMGSEDAGPTSSANAKNGPSKRESSQSTLDAAGSTTLQNLVCALPSYADKDQVSELSVSFVFICLLHLANENGLVIEGRDDLSDLQVGMPMKK